MAFENLVRSLGQNAAMLLGGYADPRTGQPMLDLEGAREMIDMLDALREKTLGNLAPEEDSLVMDILGNLKLAFMEMTKAAAAAAMQDKAKSRIVAEGLPCPPRPPNSVLEFTVCSAPEHPWECPLWAAIAAYAVPRIPEITACVLPFY